MKLFSKYNSLSILAAGLVFLITVAAMYFIFREVLIRQLDKSLLGERDEIIEYIQTNKALPETEKVYDERTVIEEEKLPYTQFKFRTKQKEVNSDKDEPVRALYFGVDLNDKHYRVTVIRSLNEMNHLLLYIVLAAVGAVLLLLLFIFLINRLLVKKLLRPFYKTLSDIESYQLSDKQPLQLEATNIYEFKLLNEKLTRFSERVISDYSVLKDFTANAAHEMQTPLSVIRTHTDQLLQQENLSNEEIGSLQKIEATVNKLSRLNHSLLLLTRLESNPFTEKKLLELDKKIAAKCEELAEIIEARKITVELQLEPLGIIINEQLWDIISNNLLSNAIKYNTDAGRIIISTTASQFSISNTSYLPELDGRQVFHRFYRHPASGVEGNGLGLAIVKQAVALAGFVIAYTYANDLHTYSISFTATLLNA